MTATTVALRADEPSGFVSTDTLLWLVPERAAELVAAHTPEWLVALLPALSRACADQIGPLGESLLFDDAAALRLSEWLLGVLVTGAAADGLLAGEVGVTVGGAHFCPGRPCPHGHDRAGRLPLIPAPCSTARRPSWRTAAQLRCAPNVLCPECAGAWLDWGRYEYLPYAIRGWVLPGMPDKARSRYVEHVDRQTRERISEQRGLVERICARVHRGEDVPEPHHGIPPLARPAEPHLEAVPDPAPRPAPQPAGEEQLLLFADEEAF